MPNMIALHKQLAARREDGEEGFTLIELMVVVLIIAILIAIAIPTFLGARKRAQDRAAQSSLRNTVTAAKAIFTDNETYTPADATALQSGEPSLQFGATSTDPVEVAVVTHADQLFVASTYSKAGKCWYVQDVTGPSGASNPGTRWAMSVSATASCPNKTAPVQTSGSWYRNPSDADANPF